jgi:hypothetical protein
LVAVVDVGVVGGVLVVVVVVVELVVVTVVVVVVVCNLESAGRHVSNSVNNMKSITKIHYLLVGGTHSECPRDLAIGRSCECCDESFARRGRGSILRERCRCIAFRRCVRCQPSPCR